MYGSVEIDECIIEKSGGPHSGMRVDSGHWAHWGGKHIYGVRKVASGQRGHPLAFTFKWALYYS